MNAQDLKNSILQLAVQGKLVEQRAEEGTARELLEQIKLEKDQLIKDKKIKKEKNVEYVSEYPFDIPETWIWARLGDIVYNKSGLSYKKGDLDNVSNDMVRVFRGGNIQDLQYVIKTDDVQIDRSYVKEELYLKRNMLITPAVTSLEHIGKMARIDTDMDSTVVGGFVLMLIPYISIDVLSEYMLYALSSYYHRKQCRGITNKSGQAFYNLSREKLMNFVIPIPPLEEQHRIVAKIEEILPYIDKYDKAYTKLEAFNKKFPEDMKKSILQMAMQGKLVEQRPEEGTADELYEQIVAEKAQLIKEGKIKKEKLLPEITEDEIPFEIPSSWKWVIFKDITKEISDGIHGTPEYDDNGEYYFINGNNLVQGKIIYKSDTRRVNKAEYEKYKKNLDNNTILMSINGTIGNVAYYNDEPIILGKSACYIVVHDSVYKEFVRFFLTSGYFLGYATNSATQTTIKNVSLKSMRNVPIPLPPFEEQKRIVAKIEELLPYCDQLIK